MVREMDFIHPSSVTADPLTQVQTKEIVQIELKLAPDEVRGLARDGHLSRGVNRSMGTIAGGSRFNDGFLVFLLRDGARW